MNEYSRPQLNYRYWLSVTPDSTDNYDGRQYWFGVVTYNQAMEYPPHFHIQTLSTSNFSYFTLDTYWNGQGNNYIRIQISSNKPLYKLNVNVS